VIIMQTSLAKKGSVGLSAIFLLVVLGAISFVVWQNLSKFSFTTTKIENKIESVSNETKETIRDGPVNNLISVPVSKVSNITITAKDGLVGIVGKFFRTTVEARGGGSPYSWRIKKGRLPPGVFLKYISQPGCVGDTCPNYDWIDYSIWLVGTPTKSGTYKFEVEVSDLKGNIGTEVFSFAVSLDNSTKTPLLDCGKSTFIVIAGGPSGPYGEQANAKARQYFSLNGLKIEDESGSRFVVQPTVNTRDYWMGKIVSDMIGSSQYDNVGCDWAE